MDACRYWLERRFLLPGGRLVFVMLNPSTADERRDDPTIRRCIGRAKRLGCSELVVVNLFALRATDPAELRGQVEEAPTRPEVQAWEQAFHEGGTFVAAWGGDGGRRWLGDLIRARERWILRLALAYKRQLHALGVTRTGAPRHPLYVRGDAELRPWPTSA